MTPNKVKPLVLLLLGVFISVSLIVFVNVQIVLSKLDLSNLESLPNMAPQINYYFIPVIFLPVALFSMLTNYLVLRSKKISIEKAKPFYLGLSYGLIISFSTFINLEISVSLSFILSIFLTWLTVHLVTEGLNEKTL